MRTWLARYICLTSLNTPGIISSTTLKNKKVKSHRKVQREDTWLLIEEFVGLRPKMYSLLYRESNKMVEKKVAKKIAKHQTKDQTRTL